MPFIRHKQRAITSVSPVPGQGRWINPNKGKELLRSFWTFGSDSYGVIPLINFDTNGPYEWTFTCAVAAGVAQSFFGQLSGAAGVRLTLNVTGTLTLRINGSDGNFGANVVLESSPFPLESATALVYEISISGDGTGPSATLSAQLRGGALQTGDTTLVAANAVTADCGIGANNIGINPFAGAIQDLKFLANDVLVYHWPMDEGIPATTFIETATGGGTFDAPITNNGGGFWTP